MNSLQKRKKKIKLMMVAVAPLRFKRYVFTLSSCNLFSFKKTRAPLDSSTASMVPLVSKRINNAAYRKFVLTKCRTRVCT